ncbi:hypothetical protein ANANG_G00202150 [Anguilla anguilla]|uniref:Uncharacterized protein n=1 Tax=Anguilla anguilla TaxID=7936 RepID=A0A9D3RTP2_ANGAN|nr:hypothetical protein ANANG_G00202150 [Anguilla anguilla]
MMSTVNFTNEEKRSASPAQGHRIHVNGMRRAPAADSVLYTSLCLPVYSTMHTCSSTAPPHTAHLLH